LSHRIDHGIPRIGIGPQTNSIGFGDEFGRLELEPLPT